MYGTGVGCLRVERPKKEFISKIIQIKHEKSLLMAQNIILASFFVVFL